LWRRDNIDSGAVCASSASRAERDKEVIRSRRGRRPPISPQGNESIKAISTCTTPKGALSAQQRAVIAAEITRIATASPDSIYAGGKPAANAVIVGRFRESRRKEDKTRVLNELWSMYQKVTALSDDQLWVSFTEIAVNDAMMFGAILPAPGHEAAWLARLGRPDLDRAASPKQARACDWPVKALRTLTAELDPLKLRVQADFSRAK
jgi:hypothetical protein